MDTQFKKGIIEVCVLAELDQGDTYGYQLVKKLSQTLEVGESTIYTILRRLTKDGVLDQYDMTSSDGPTRKYYTLTGAGKTKKMTLLNEWKQFRKKVDELLGGLL